MITKLKYGKNVLRLNLNENVCSLSTKEPDFNTDKSNFTYLLSRLLNEKQINSLSKIAIVVSDKTRLCEYSVYLPWIIEILFNLNIRKKNITFYIAYGTHTKQTETESKHCYGKLYNEYNFIHHNCDDKDIFVNLGTTTAGTPIEIRKDLLLYNIIITFGSLTHHYFAGYGGGRKLIFPGLASRKAINHNHSLFLDKKKSKLNDYCQPGNLINNPVANDLYEIDVLLPNKISIHGILNSAGKLCQLFTTGSYKEYLKITDLYDSFFRSKPGIQYDMVIASCGGFPKDINFIQAHKALHNSAAFVKDGGILILLAECIEGIGNEKLLKLFHIKGFKNIFNHLIHNYEGNGGTALSLINKTDRINIYLLTSLSDDICRLLKINLLSLENLQQLIDKNNNIIACIENASILIK